MLEAISIKKMSRDILERLHRKPKTLITFDSASPSDAELMARVNSLVRSHSFVGILLARPNSSFAKSEVVDHINYFHHRSDEDFNFFCCGYGAYWSPGMFKDQKHVLEVDGVKWLFSDKAFVSVVRELEDFVAWKFSGETELLLLDVSPDASAKHGLHVHDAIVCNLEAMVKDGAITSVRALFEDIIRYASSNENANAWTYSDRQAGSGATRALKEVVLALLPQSARELYTKSKHFVVKKI